MRHRDDETLRRWLTAESADAPAAEEELASLFEAALPARRPTAGFADRVMAEAIEAGLVPTPAGVPLGLGVLRWVAAMCLLLAGTTTALLPHLLPDLLAKIPFAGAVEAGSDILVILTGWLEGAVSFWDRLVRLVSPLAEAASTTPVVTTMAMAVVLSALAFRLLYEILIAPQRSWTHADST